MVPFDACVGRTELVEEADEELFEEKLLEEELLEDEDELDDDSSSSLPQPASSIGATMTATPPNNLIIFKLESPMVISWSILFIVHPGTHLLPRT